MYSKIDDIKADTDCRLEIARFLGEPISSDRNKSVWSCPFHSEKTIGAFHVWRDGYHCFSCGKHGDVFDAWQYFTDRSLRELLAEHDDIDPAEAARRHSEIQRKTDEARAAIDAERKRQLAKLHESERHIFYNDNLRNSLHAQALWMSRGIPQYWQDYFDLGYSGNFTYTGKAGKLTASSLVIPIKKIGGEVVTIRHRLINSLDGSRYRPEISGLGAHPFICDTSLPKSDDLIIMEGEIKAAVTYLTYDKSGSQVIGVPSKGMMVETIKSTRGRNALVIPDPDGVEEARAAAKFAGARILIPVMSMDDFILDAGVTTAQLRRKFKMARYA